MLAQRWLLVFGVLVFCVCGGKSQSPVTPILGQSVPVVFNFKNTVSLDSVRSLPSGTKMMVRTAFDVNGSKDMAVEFVSVVDDLMPPISYIMLKAVDPSLEQIGGAASGMSGSPVFLNGGVVGALSLAQDGQSRPPFYFFATPIGEMSGDHLGNRVKRLSKPVAWHGMNITELTLPLVSTGVSGKFLEKLFPQGFLPYDGTMVAGGKGSFQSSFEPGDPLAVALVVGDEVSIGAVGTITYRDGDRVIGFGHPFLGTGDGEYPIIGAKVLAEISSLYGPSKFITLDNNVVGMITVDSHAGVAGLMGPKPVLVPLVFEGVLPGGNALRQQHYLATKGIFPYLQADAATSALFSPYISRLDDQGGKSLRVQTTMTFGNYPETINTNRLFADPTGPITYLAYEAGSNFYGNYYQLMSHPDFALIPSQITVKISLVDSVLSARPVKIDCDTVAQEGSILSVVATIRMARGADRQIRLELPLADTLQTGFYSLQVSPASSSRDSVDAKTTDEDLGGLPALFKKLNEPDRSEILRATLSFVSEEPKPAPADTSSTPTPPDIPVVGPPTLPPFKGGWVSTEQSVGAIISGEKDKQIRIHR